MEIAERGCIGFGRGCSLAVTAKVSLAISIMVVVEFPFAKNGSIIGHSEAGLFKTDTLNLLQLTGQM